MLLAEVEEAMDDFLPFGHMEVVGLLWLLVLVRQIAHGFLASQVELGVASPGKVIPFSPGRTRRVFLFPFH